MEDDLADLMQEIGYSSCARLINLLSNPLFLHQCCEIFALYSTVPSKLVRSLISSLVTRP